MGTYTKISSTAFEEMQLDAGILLNTFNVASPNVQDSHIITATTGGINAENVKDYLAYNKVFACGGSWMVKGDLIKAGRFDEIERLVKEAVSIVKEIRG